MSSKLTPEQVAQGIDEFHRKIVLLRKGKSNDYATQEDGLFNFREGARRTGTTLPQYLWTLVTKHLIALESDSNNPNLHLSEGVADRLLDVSCYCSLLYTYLREQDILKRKSC